MGGDSRQLAGEVQVRRREAEALRQALAAEGIQVGELDDAIATLRRLQNDGVVGDPKELAALQAAVVSNLQRVEYQLWLRFGGVAGGRPAVGEAGRAPARYQQMVDEYYRSIAGERP
jgi:hypothetical protein